jgi:hypothetical protein
LATNKTPAPAPSTLGLNLLAVGRPQQEQIRDGRAQQAPAIDRVALLIL